MRIGLLTTSFPRHPGDYAGGFVGDRVAQLAAEGLTVDVLAAGARDGVETADRLTVTRIGTAARLFYADGAPEALERGGAAWVAAGAFFAALAGAARTRAHAWDLIESHWLVPSALAASAAAPGRPRRAWAHSGDVALLERIPLGRTLASRLAGDGTDLRFVSEALRDRFCRLVGQTVGSVSPLPISPAVFAPRSARDAGMRRLLGLSAPTVLSVGRLVPIKGHARLLHGAFRAAANGHTAEVVILGDGPERERLTRLAGRLEIPLRLPGFVPRAEVADWMRAADLLVFPSVRLPNGRAEGAPTVLREAAAVGIPVHASGDPAEISRAIATIRPRAIPAPIT